MHKVKMYPVEIVEPVETRHMESVDEIYAWAKDKCFNVLDGHKAALYLEVIFREATNHSGNWKDAVSADTSECNIRWQWIVVAIMWYFAASMEEGSILVGVNEIQSWGYMAW